jgi:hypothetical protein
MPVAVGAYGAALYVWAGPEGVVWVAIWTGVGAGWVFTAAKAPAPTPTPTPAPATSPTEATALEITSRAKLAPLPPSDNPLPRLQLVWVHINTSRKVSTAAANRDRTLVTIGQNAKLTNSNWTGTRDEGKRVQYCQT